MIVERNIFVLAKSQHLLESLWFVMGKPSKGILVLKVCTSFSTVDDFSRISARLWVEKAEKARRFLGSFKIVSIQNSVSRSETIVLRSWEDAVAT